MLVNQKPFEKTIQRMVNISHFLFVRIEIAQKMDIKTSLKFEYHVYYDTIVFILFILIHSVYFTKNNNIFAR